MTIVFPSLKKLGDHDIYALLDSTSPEARTFTTYLGYWNAISSMIHERWTDDPYVSLLADLQGRKAYRKLQGKKSQAAEDDLRGMLLNAWSSELALYLVQLEDAERLWLANQWAHVQSYYAVSRMASAWFCARNGDVLDTHRGLLRSVSAQITDTQLMPYPWSLVCEVSEPTARYAGFVRSPRSVSNLSKGADPHDLAAMMLRTTRGREVIRRVEQVKQHGRLDRAPRGEKLRQDLTLEPTTIFEFAWRMRTRSNYGDPAMFYVGTLTPERSREYAEAIRLWTRSTMFVFESFIAQKARTLLVDTAVHFISRDRSRLADAVLGERLRALDLLD